MIIDSGVIGPYFPASFPHFICRPGRHSRPSLFLPSTRLWSSRSPSIDPSLFIYRGKTRREGDALGPRVFHLCPWDRTSRGPVNGPASTHKAVRGNGEGASESPGPRRSSRGAMPPLPPLPPLPAIPSWLCWGSRLNGVRGRGLTRTIEILSRSLGRGSLPRRVGLAGSVSPRRPGQPLWASSPNRLVGPHDPMKNNQ